MNNIARVLALPIISAGIIGGAALGLAGTASAATHTEPHGPGHSFAPETHAHPAPGALTGVHHHRAEARQAQ